jgi:hypothetical protein
LFNNIVCTNIETIFYMQNNCAKKKINRQNNVHIFIQLSKLLHAAEKYMPTLSIR